MFKLSHKIPKEIYVAVSGGIDSMVLLDFVRRGGRKPHVLHFNHNTQHGSEAEHFLAGFCQDNSVPINFGWTNYSKPKNKSQEEWWREERYRFFDSYTDKPILMAHNLDDAVETWVFSSLHGTGYLIPIKRDNIIRPFLLVSRKQIESWAKRKSVLWIEDKSNQNTKYIRNYIRHEMMPHVLKVNPGIRKVIRKKYER